MKSVVSTKRRILDSAYSLFVENGYQGTSMRDIAKDAGIKAGSIYNHFGGKEEIFEAVFIEKHPLFRILEILNDVKGETAENLLTNAINQLHREFQRDKKLLNLFFIELIEMGGKHVPLAIKKNFPTDSNFMKQIFRVKSEIRDIREPVIIRALIGTILASIVFTWFIGESNIKRWGSMSETTDVLLWGILKSK
ncbi:TetR/AcrR family transcriptional regulator [Candidatus Thorarchaeota archaeon]|nr:MAG: TetR/AcrR family transcriptional regulator [Candidatus Thorarchaeota archaeon]